MNQKQINDLAQKFLKTLESDFSEQKSIDLISMEIAVLRFSEFLKVQLSDLDPS